MIFSVQRLSGRRNPELLSCAPMRVYGPKQSYINDLVVSETFAHFAAEDRVVKVRLLLLRS